MSNSKPSRPTPASLPKLTIPAASPRRPQEISASIAPLFVAYCARYHRAPPSVYLRLPSSIPRRPLPSTSSSPAPSSQQQPPAMSWLTLDDPYELSPEEYDAYEASAAAVPRTLAFTRNEEAELAQRRAVVGDARAAHAGALEQYQLDLDDDVASAQEALAEVRARRQAREENVRAIARILDGRRIRRRFRQDFNRLLPGW
ncbi:hypothetical protein GGR56DRAFT_675294 [Xylariaceae sp. FL0804]|nr:hypothetical protein GGR56DRAFT_675294 [Xylariaceae sp. FL0804]